MTKIKLCGLSRPCDMEAANDVMPEYVGFVFAPESRRRITPEAALKLREQLSPGIQAVGVFVNERIERIAGLLNSGVIDMAQLHGGEDNGYIAALRALTGKPVIKAFQITGRESVISAENSAADLILLDSGAGTGSAFDWSLIQDICRPYFLAGGLDAGNAAEAAARLHPFAVDVSSGIETNGSKDRAKMEAFVAAVRKENRL